MEAFFIFWIILAAAVGIFADYRGRNGWGFGLLSLLLSPLLVFIILLVISDLNVEAAKEVEKRREYERHIESLRAMAASRLPSSAAASSPAAEAGEVRRGTISVADELKKLVELRDAGALTDDEFQQQKAVLLARAIRE